MLVIKKIYDITQLDALKCQYLSTTTAALDGMWLCGFLPMATHFGFYENNTLVGYCCINADGYLLQFHLDPQCLLQASELFTLIVEQNSAVIGEVKGAFVSTAEPLYLSLCLDNYSTHQTNALMYQQDLSAAPFQGESIAMDVATDAQLSDFVQFTMHAIGAPEVWLTGYYQRLINRQELVGYWKRGKLLASGECRLFDTVQTEYADLGMIVAESERGKGIATQVLNYLISCAESKGLTAMCSTEMANIGAQKAILKAGFNACHRIVQFSVNS
ncbi:GNAT family N-acetyltransferase [Moritella dasanensis]|uniref:GNAT family N-acetyltransferase n=1 Tax=Moritella dasanensis TaxID=428031 RepID=UPI00030302B9|nr:GNAT family N-acetyltransferase [Moritella dasanensis]